MTNVTERMTKQDERGLVSFMVTIIMMLVISLIVVGFTQVTNSNRREQLDRQLSQQAFYAAESGVNKAVSVMSAALAAGNPIKEQTTCKQGNYDPGTLGVGVEYTCILVNPIVSQIVTTANETSSKVIPINLVASNGTNFNTGNKLTLNFTWSAKTGGDPNPVLCSTRGDFTTTASNNCGYPLLRVDIMSTKNLPSISAAGLAGNTSSFFMQPVSSGLSTPSLPSFATKGYIVEAPCSSVTATCTGSVSFTGNAMTTLYYTRITTLYGDTERVVIDAVNSLSESAYFKDAQAQVDVTGRAQDVLRRVQVTVPLQQFDNSLIPQGAVHSTADVCKQFSISSASYTPGC